MSVDLELEAFTLLSRLRDATLRHPVAVQSAFAFLTAEGARFAKTSAGAELLASLERSALVAQSRILWEGGTMGALRGASAEPLPESLIDTLAQLLRETAAEELVGRWVVHEAERDAP